MQVLLTGMFAMLLCATAAGDAGVRAWIATEPTPQGVRVKPYVQATGGMLHLRYELLSTKHGVTGNSNSRQSGPVMVACCDPRLLAQLQLSVQPGEHYTLALRLFDNRSLVAEAQIIYPADRP